MPRPNIYVHLQDVHISRKKTSPVAMVYDCDGEVVDSFPKEFTDDQIMIILQSINKFYDKGVETGKVLRTQEIKSMFKQLFDL